MNLQFAVLSGFLASLGSVFGKLSFSYSIEYEGYWKLLITLVFQFLMILSNISGLAIFTKSLTEIDSTVVATVTNTTCNFIFSGIFGYVIFQEMITLEWLLGTSLTVIGFSLITSSGSTNTSSSKKD